nr:type II toxin-antitoxin system PemK/MazF family toxin [Demequina gelatinilytica]
MRSTPHPSASRSTATPAAYPGDFTGRPRISYSPTRGGAPEPGEVVWTWVPFEEDHAQGKDRPVLLVGRDGRWLLGLMLTSKDHDLDAAQEARWGRYWMDIGAGPWDSRGRPSEVRLDRIVRVDPAGVRREGAMLDRATFDRVTGSLKDHHS